MKLLIGSRKSLTLLDAIMKRAAGRHRLTLAQAWVFAILGSHRVANPVSIAVSLGWARQQAHRTLKELQLANLAGWISRDEQGRKQWELTDEGKQRWRQLQHTLEQYEEKLDEHEVDLNTFAELSNRMVNVLLNRPQEGWSAGLAALIERPIRADVQCCGCLRCTCACHPVPY